MSHEYVQVDPQGALRVGSNGVSLDSVLAAWMNGHSPETIRAQYPSLSLEEVYGALTWILAHEQEVSEYLKRQDKVWDQWRQRAGHKGSSLLERLRTASARMS